MQNDGRCGCQCHRFIGLLVVLFGLAFLLQAFGVLSARFVEVSWPILVILAGLKKMARGMCKCCEAARNE